MKFYRVCLKLFVAYIFCGFSFGYAEDLYKKSEDNSNKVRVYIPSTSEEESIELRGFQLATVKIYLSSLGDMVDKCMVSLLDLNTNQVVASQLSDIDGIVVFRKVPAGSYHVYVNKRVKEDGELSSVSVADVILSKY